MLAGTIATVTFTNPQDNQQSVRDTIKVMTEIAIQQMNSPIVLSVVDNLQLSGTGIEQCRAIWGFVKSKLTFKEDEHQLIHDGHSVYSELLRTPEYLLIKASEGDCDDYSLLAATLLLAGTNLGVAFTTIKTHDERPNDWSHVYVSAITPEGVVALDCSHGPYTGWEMPDRFVSERKYWVVRELRNLKRWWE